MDAIERLKALRDKAASHSGIFAAEALCELVTLIRDLERESAGKWKPKVSASDMTACPVCGTKRPDLVTVRAGGVESAESQQLFTGPQWDAAYMFARSVDPKTANDHQRDLDLAREVKRLARRIDDIYGQADVAKAAQSGGGK